MKGIINAILSRLTGYIVQRDRTALQGIAIKELIEKYDIDFILDLGANIGQFSEEIFKNGYTGRILSVEPLSDAHAKLLATSAKKPNWIIASRCAVGSEDTTIKINVSENSYSSSVLGLHEQKKREAPQANYIREEKVELKKVDTLIQAFDIKSSKSLLKIDVQGYELEVLKGADDFLRQTKIIITELSLVPLYEGGADYAQVISYLDDKGFSPIYYFEEFKSFKTGALLQINGVFIQREN